MEQNEKYIQMTATPVGRLIGKLAVPTVITMLITSIYKAGFTESAVSLPLSPEDPWYTAEGIQKNVRHFYEKTESIENFEDVGITVGGSTNK